MNASSHGANEMQLIEQNMQQLLMQKQSVQLEFNETTNAIDEVQKSGDEVYRVIGNIMVKTAKDSMLKELEDRKKLLELQLNAVEKQEALLESKMQDLKKSKSSSK